MKTDTFFYKVFQAFPHLLFEVLNLPPSAAAGYSFISVEVKEKGFRFDGIFFPNCEDQPIYFTEVQFQAKPDFYWEYFGEIFLYLNEYRPQQNWRGVIIFPIGQQTQVFFAKDKNFLRVEELYGFTSIS